MEDSHVDPYYLSGLLAKKVLSATGEVLGKISDLVVDLDPPPGSSNLVWRCLWSKELFCTSWAEVSSLQDSGIILQVQNRPLPLAAWELSPPSRIFLRDFLLDKQIVDINGAKLFG